VETLEAFKMVSRSLTSLHSKAESILNAIVATNWSETNTGNAKRISNGVGGSQTVNVSTCALTLMLFYSAVGQKDKVISLAILT